ncbi:aryl-alcohol dehydrogenase [Atractiella rhizophila]|nr:aryl-alcohol dehydrogenase [Atractiella rhizophila]
MAETPIKTMKYVNLGKSGLKVSKVILGCMSYGSKTWQNWVLEEEEGLKHIELAYKLGINTFEFLNERNAVYSNGESEIILGKALKRLQIPREKVVIMTKIFMPLTDPEEKDVFGVYQDPDGHGYANRWGLSRKHIFDGVQSALKRLDVEYIDVFQCHRFDPLTPIEETMHALNDVVRLGWVRYIGMSSCFAYQFHAMQNYAITNNLTPFISMQNCYSALYREEEREMMPLLKTLGVGSIPWSPLARGFLCRPWSAPSATGNRDKEDYFSQLMLQSGTSESNKAIIDAVEAIAKERGVKMAQVAFAYVANHEAVAAPIVGTTNIDSLKELVDAVHIELTKEEIQRIEAPYVPRAVFGLTA